jgi:hypothetical protein
MHAKQLEWEEDSYGDFEASGFWGIFQVVHAESGEGFTASLNDYNNYEGYEEEDFPTAEEGKAYCQSLLEKQVQAALGFVDWAGDKTPKDIVNFLGKPGVITDDGDLLIFDSIPIVNMCFDEQTGEPYDDIKGAKRIAYIDGEFDSGEYDDVVLPDNWEVRNGKDRADD